MPREEYFKHQEVFSNMKSVKMKIENANFIHSIKTTDGPC